MTKKSGTKSTKTEATPAPSGLPLFYKKPVALDKNVHAGMALATNLTFDFASKVNAVPVTMIELPNIMQFYPVAFSASAPATPLAIMGLRDQENLFTDAKGNWTPNTYIPAYIRRYPFIFAKNDNGDRLTLCIDDTDGILKKSKENQLFDASGEPTDMTKNALEFCRSYQIAAEQTLEFSAALEESGILIDRHAEIRMNDGRTMTLTGFRQIDEKKYYDLPEATVKLWHDKRWTRFVYAHLFSVGNWQRLFQMMEARMGTKN